MCLSTLLSLSQAYNKMSMSPWLWFIRTKTSGGNFLKRIISSTNTASSSCSYQTDQNVASSYSSSFPSLPNNNNSIDGRQRKLIDFRYSFPISTPFFCARHYNSIGAAAAAAGEHMFSKLADDDDQQNQGMEFPGGKITFTSELNFLPGSSENRVECYRLLDEDGYRVSSNIFEDVNKELALKVYSGMATLQTMDKFFYEAQRQGRLSFYLTAFGEEAINLASAAALNSEDVILAQYREAGVLLWRGFTIKDFANQCFGNNAGHGKGRQMPIHYGSKNLNFMTISSPLATQLPQAVGVAYSLKMDKKDSCVVVYTGDGSTSEGDFHAALNFAAVMDAPVVFICRNNGWAISTPVTEQFRSDGVVVKGRAYGIRSIRVDGNDPLAVYNVVRRAREAAIHEQRPILIEAMTYRVSHHSTSDDSTKYRTKDEIEHWNTVHSPIKRFRNWIQEKGWWSDKQELELRNDAQKQVKHAIDEAEKVEKPQLKDMFEDVYKDLPSNLMEQETLLRQAIRRHPQDFPTDIPL